MSIIPQVNEFKSNETVDSLSQIILNDSTITLASFYLAVFVIGLLSNFMVIFVFAMKKGFYQYSNYFFINLSFSDVLVLLFCVPIAITDLFYPDDWQFGSFYCKFYYFLEYSVITVSSTSLILISLERYFAISNPFKVKIWFNRKNSLLTIFLVWLIAFLVSLPFLFMATFKDHQCQIDITSFELGYVIFVNTLFIFIPTMALGILYVYIIIKLRNHTNMLSKFENENEHGSKRSEVCKETSTSLMIRGETFNKSLSDYLSSTSQFDLRNINPVRYSLKKRMSVTLEQNKKGNKPIRKWRFSSIDKMQQINREDVQFINNSPYCNRKNFKSMRAFRNKSCQDNLLVDNKKIQAQKYDAKSHIRLRPVQLRINFTIILSFVTFAFFVCQLPIRIFVTWSYCLNYFHKEYMETMSENDRLIISMFSNISTIIYFFHCISNPIIYNLLSVKFRKAFISFASMNCRN